MDDWGVIDHPTSLQKGDRIRSLIVDTPSPPGLLTPAVLGSPSIVSAALAECIVLQHPEAVLAGFATGLVHQLKPASDRDVFNRRDPSSEFLQSEMGARLLGGGIECGMQPMGADAASQVSGLRPGVADVRGQDWDKGLVRGHKSQSQADHKANGCHHMFVGMNYLLKHGGYAAEKTSHLLNFLFQVTSWMARGRDVHVHCTFLLIIPPRRFNYFYY